MSIHSPKGLECPAVMVWAPDQLTKPTAPDEVRDGNLLYVELTRVVGQRAVAWAGRSRFTDRILLASKGEAMPG